MVSTLRVARRHRFLKIMDVLPIADCGFKTVESPMG
jgi:hypothetical protein